MSDQALAEELTKRRARLLPLVVILFFIQQGLAFGDHLPAARNVDLVKLGAWVILSLVMLWVLATGGFNLFRSAAIKKLMNDELTRANRMAGVQLGFFVAMLGALLLFVFAPSMDINVRELARLIVALGIAPAALYFAFLERRALGDG